MRKDKITVIQLVPELDEGGVERGTVELNRELVKRGHTSIVISKGGRLVGEIEGSGGRHITFDLCSKNILTAPLRVLKLGKILAEIKPDIIHARSRVPAWLAWYANRKLQLPFVTTVHGIYSVNAYSRIMTRGDRVICISELLRERVCKEYDLDPATITVIQRGVDLERFDPEHLDQDFIRAFKKKHHLDGKFIVSSIGRITYLKDYETFIKAIGLASKEIPTITGVIVGGATADKQSYLQDLKELAQKLGVADRIIFAGSQTRIAEIYGLSDLTVNGSLTMGNVGRTVVESLAMDTPVLATSYEGLVNLVEDGKNGFIIATKNPKELADKISRAKQSSFQGIRSRINSEYTLQAMVEKTLAVYRSLTKEMAP